jgi:exportin-2 (importin alpha re-exporter)
MTPPLTSQIKTGILEIVEVCILLVFLRSTNVLKMQLYIKLYPDQLQKTSSVEHFVQGVWTLIGSNNLFTIADDPVGL